jgi:Tfp pilus assembly protein PilN
MEEDDRDGDEEVYEHRGGRPYGRRATNNLPPAAPVDLVWKLVAAGASLAAIGGGMLTGMFAVADMRASIHELQARGDLLSQRIAEIDRRESDFDRMISGQIRDLDSNGSRGLAVTEATVKTLQQQIDTLNTALSNHNDEMMQMYQRQGRTPPAHGGGGTGH